MDWRRLEKLLEDYARRDGFQLDLNRDWDKCIMANDHPFINLTLLAQHLAQELSHDPL